MGWEGRRGGVGLALLLVLMLLLLVLVLIMLLLALVVFFESSGVPWRLLLSSS